MIERPMTTHEFYFRVFSYRLDVLFAQRRYALEVQALELVELARSAAIPELTVQESPRYEFPAPMAHKTFLFAPKTISPEIALQAVWDSGAQFGSGFTALLEPPIVSEEVRPMVLDLGSNGGIDCFLAAKQVGDQGKVIGVDMTDEMLAKANASKARMGRIPQGADRNAAHRRQ